jgi:cytochrome c oxidase subunit 2
LALELTWMIFPLLLVIGMFLWGAKVFFAYATPPPDALEVFATGRRWMWKIQHPTGQREINELHIPVGQPIKVNLTSMDVIHSFYIPAFRVKSDVIPGRDMTLWFEATRPGKYHLYCAEYCGTEHSLMGGWVYAMDPADYEAWLRSGNAVETMVQAGERLFRQYGCSGCHSGNSSVRAPQLEGIYGKPVPLKDGTTVIADDLYLRDSILMPRKEIAGGYDPLMPTFQGQINEEDLVQIVYYIKSLR